MLIYFIFIADTNIFSCILINDCISEKANSDNYWPVHLMVRYLSI